MKIDEDEQKEQTSAGKGDTLAAFSSIFMVITEIVHGKII